MIQDMEKMMSIQTFRINMIFTMLFSSFLAESSPSQTTNTQSSNKENITLDQNTFPNPSFNKHNFLF